MVFVFILRCDNLVSECINSNNCFTWLSSDWDICATPCEKKLEKVTNKDKFVQIFRGRAIIIQTDLNLCNLCYVVKCSCLMTRCAMLVLILPLELHMNILWSFFPSFLLWIYSLCLANEENMFTIIIKKNINIWISLVIFIILNLNCSRFHMEYEE